MAPPSLERLLSVPAFRHLSSTQLESLRDNMQQASFAGGAIIPAASGVAVRLTDGPVGIHAIYHAGARPVDQTLTESALSAGTPLDDGAVLPTYGPGAPDRVVMQARDGVDLADLASAAVPEVTGSPAWRGHAGQFSALLRTLRALGTLNAGVVFRQLGNLERTLLAEQMRLREVRPGEVLFRAGDAASALYVPGPNVEVSLSAEGPVAPTQTMGAALGREALAPRSLRPRYAATATVDMGGQVLVLSRRRYLALAVAFRAGGGGPGGFGFAGLGAGGFGGFGALGTGGLGGLGASLSFVTTYRRGLSTAMARSAVFAGITNGPLLAQIARGAVATLWRVGHHTPIETQQPGLVFVQRGALIRHRTESAPASNATPGRFGAISTCAAGGLTGDEAFVRRLPVGDDQTPRLPTELVVVPRAHVDAVMSTATQADRTAYRQNVRAIEDRLNTIDGRRATFGVPRRPAGSTTLPSGGFVVPGARSVGRPTDIALVETTASVTGLSALVEALADRIVSDFQESVAVLYLRGARNNPPGKLTRTRTTQINAGVPALSVWEKSLPAWRPTTSVTTRQSRELTVHQVIADVANAAAKHHVRTHVQQLIIVCDSPAYAETVRDDVDRVVWLNEGPDVRRPLTWSERAPFGYVAVVDPGAGVKGTPPCPYPPGAVRLLAARGTLPPAEQLSRWARAFTDRRVGVALGGGGALAYAHLAVLYQLDKRGVPVDALSGSSFGTVVAGYVAEHPFASVKPKPPRWWRRRRALHHPMVEHRGWLQLTMMAHAISGEISSRMLDAAMKDPDPRLWPVPVFPVATDLTTSSQMPFVGDEFGHKVRASGGFSPIFPATPARGRHLVDGGLSTNVPALVLQHEGVRLIVASNAVPPSRAWKIGPYATKSPRVQAVVELCMDVLDPRRRWFSAYWGQQSLMSTAGEFSAQVASSHFVAEHVTTLPFWLMDPSWVVRHAYTVPGFRRVVDDVERRWNQLKAPRP